MQRADVAQVQGVADQRAHARAAGRRLDAAGAGEADEIPDDEEVVGEAQLVDDLQLALQPRHHLGRERALGAALGVAGIALVEPFQAQLPQVAGRGGVFRQAEDGEVPLAQLQLDVDAVGDLLAAAEGLLLAGKGGVHLLGAAEVELVALHLHAVGIAAELAGVHAQQHVLGLGVVAEDVMDVAGGHQRQAHAVGQVHRRLQCHPLHFQIVVLNLDEVAVAEEFVEPGGGFPGLLPGWPLRRPPAGGSTRWRRSRSGKAAPRGGPLATRGRCGA